MAVKKAELAIPESELSESFVRSSGPGGQNVNKGSTAVQLRFDMANSPSLDARQKSRLARLASHLLTSDGVLIIEASRFRTQVQNRRAGCGSLPAAAAKAGEDPADAGLRRAAPEIQERAVGRQAHARASWRGGLKAAKMTAM